MFVQLDEGMIFTVEANKYFEQTGIDIGVRFEAEMSGVGVPHVD